MLKRITEPQAMYTKQGALPPMPGYPAQPSMSSSSNFSPKKFNKKIVTSVIAVALFLVVGVAGVMTALRQQQVAGPVAPNAPESKPLAAIEPGSNCRFCAGVCGDYGSDSICAAAPPPPPGFSCVQNPTLQQPYCITVPSADSLACALPFTVAGPTPTPSATPAPVAVSCLQKNAFLVAGTTVTPLEPQTAIDGNTTVKYVLTLSSTGGLPTAPVVVEDQLAANTTWEAKPAELPTGVTIASGAGNKLTITVQPFQGNKVIPYYIKVAQKNQPFNIVNSAKIVNNGASQAGNTCSIALKTTPSGVAVCSAKTAYTLDESNNRTAIASNGTVKAGTEYYYNIKVQANGLTTGAVTVKDTLPAGVQFVSAVGSTEMTTSTDSSGRTVVTANLGTIGQSATSATAETKDVAFKVKLAADVTPATLKNSAVVATAGNSNTSTCEHSIVVPPEGVAACVSKEMHTASYNDGKAANETRISDGSSLTENREFYYRIKVSSDKQTTGQVNIIDSLPSALEVVAAGDFKNEGGQMVARFDAFTGEKVAEMKVKIKTAVQGSVTNTAKVDTMNSGKAAVSCESSFTVPTYTCNSSCDNEDQCKRASADYSCVSTNEGMRCRLGSNHESTSCQGKPGSTPAPTPTPSTTTTVTTVGCNYTCSTNADCSNSSHICYEGRCRLESNVTSASCSQAVTTTQPELPQELPQTGPEDWANWLKAGLVTLGIGAILLLLL